MTKRVRLVAVQITPQFVVDDGEHLTPINVQARTVNAADWPDVVGLVSEATEQLEAQLNDDEPAL